MTQKTTKTYSKSGKVQQSNGTTNQEKNEARNQKFKVADLVSIKIDRVDKLLHHHSNLLLWKIEEIVNTYARLVAKFGRITTLISPTRLYTCTAQNIELDYTTELLFSAACKKAV